MMTMIMLMIAMMKNWRLRAQQPTGDYLSECGLPLDRLWWVRPSCHHHNHIIIIQSSYQHHIIVISSSSSLSSWRCPGNRWTRRCCQQSPHTVRQELPPTQCFSMPKKSNTVRLIDVWKFICMDDGWMKWANTVDIQIDGWIKEHLRPGNLSTNLWNRQTHK